MLQFRMASKLAIIVIIVIMSENLNCVNAIRCRQCMDLTLKMDSEEMQKIMEDNGVLDALPSCTEDDASDCDDMFDFCSAQIVQYSASILNGQGEGLQGSFMYTYSYRACAASSVPQTTDEDTMCDAVKESIKSSNDADGATMIISLDESFKCKVITCQTDLCNSQGVEVFEENGGVETGGENGKGNYVNVSSGNRVVGCIGIFLPFALFSGLSSF